MHTPPNLESPKLWQRLGCACYELFMLFALGLIPGAVGAITLAILGEAFISPIEACLRLLSVVVYAFYFTWFWSRGGQTLPMQTWKIKVVQQNGLLLTPKQALARFFACWLGLLPGTLFASTLNLGLGQTLISLLIGWLGYTFLSQLHPNKQFFHDALCKTLLVKKTN